MPGIARVGQDNAGGGVIIGPGVSTVIVNGSPVSTVGDTISGHGSAPHTTPTIETGSKTVFADGKPVSIAQVSATTCSHPLTPGSGDVIVS